MNEVIPMILGFVGAILTALTTWAIQRIISFLNKRIKNEKHTQCLNVALEIITNVVKETYQTYVDNIKGTDAWTKEAKQKAFEQARQKAGVLLTGEVKDYLISRYGDLDTWLAAAIESQIYNLKNVDKG